MVLVGLTKHSVLHCDSSCIRRSSWPAAGEVHPQLAPSPLFNHLNAQSKLQSVVSVSITLHTCICANRCLCSTAFLRFKLPKKSLGTQTHRGCGHRTRARMCTKIVHVYKCGHQEEEKSPCAASRSGTCKGVHDKKIHHDQKCKKCGR